MTKKHVSLILVLSMLFVIVFSTVPVIARAQQEEKHTFGMVMINLTNPFYVSAIEAAQKAADKIGAELIIKSADGSLEKEIGLIENFIETNVDVILADFINAEGLTDVCKKAYEAGIPVISLFNEINSDYNYSCAYDHYVGFKGVTYAVAEALNGKGKVCVMQGGIGNWANDERTRGYEEAIANYPEIELLSMQPCDWDPAKGVAITETWLTTYDQIDAILCMTDGVTPSIIEMVGNAGRTEEIKVAGNDGEVAVLEAMNAGQAIADALLSSLRGGYLAILYANELAKGNKVEKTVWIPVSLVVTEDVKSILETSKADMSFVDIISVDEALQVVNSYANEFDGFFQ